jgi:hypothetical protein
MTKMRARAAKRKKTALAKAPAKRRPLIIVPQPPPPGTVRPVGWGQDHLTSYLEQAAQNRWATFNNQKAEFEKLSDIDSCFMRIVCPSGSMDGPAQWVNPHNEISASLFLRAHAAFRVACEHSMGGQTAETYPAARACLEYAAYSLHISHAPLLGVTWLRRHDSPATKRAAKAAFQHIKVAATVAAADTRLGRVFETLYDHCIDYGGHPNERSVTTNTIARRTDTHHERRQVYLHGDDTAQALALKTTARVGLCALEILEVPFKARYMLLDVTSKIPGLRKGL